MKLFNRFDLFKKRTTAIYFPTLACAEKISEARSSSPSSSSSFPPSSFSTPFIISPFHTAAAALPRCSSNVSISLIEAKATAKKERRRGRWRERERKRKREREKERERERERRAFSALQGGEMQVGASACLVVFSPDLIWRRRPWLIVLHGREGTDPWQTCETPWLNSSSTIFWRLKGSNIWDGWLFY